jgi:enoyl-CoA hydratase
MELPGNEHLRVEQRGHVVIVTMNRPEARNAWSAQMLAGMADAWEFIDAEPDVRVAVLTGAGGTFCAGADLKAMSASRSAGDDGFSDKVRGADTAFRAMLRTYRVRKPLIAAVEGVAVAGGSEILQATDIRVAGQSAVFGLAEVQRALFPIGGSTVRLRRQIPFTKAMEILLTGDTITAQEALNLGLVGRVVADGQALDEALRIADRIARNGPLAVQAIKRSVIESESLPEEEALKIELEIGLRVFASEDAKEGPRAFAEKREPQYRGR